MMSPGSYLANGFLFNESDAGDELGRYIGESEPVQWMKRFIAKVACLESNVLISGPSGVGKDLVADIIHSLSKRSGSPFVKFNCASIPEEFCELKLFGVEQAIPNVIGIETHGIVESANGGTLLIDEIGDMPLKVQGRLLVFLEQREIEKPGNDTPIPIDLRILATTHQNLPDLIRQGRFREDLYYRLNVVAINVPSLKDRIEDLPELIRHFLPIINSKASTHLENIAQSALGVFSSHDWPGNIRELENILERAAILSDGDTIQEPEARIALREAFCGSHTAIVEAGQEKLLDLEGVCLKEVLHKVEKNLIIQALSQTNGVQTEAAGILGLKPKNLWKKIQKHAIMVDRMAGENAAVA